MKADEIEPGEYDDDPNVHGALRSIDTKLLYLTDILGTALEEQAEAQRQVADALNRIADIFGGMVQTWRATLPDDE